jgi:hypothetical protein
LSDASDPAVPIEAAGIGCIQLGSKCTAAGDPDYTATCIYVTNEFDYCFNAKFLKLIGMTGRSTALKMTQLDLNPAGVHRDSG